MIIARHHYITVYHSIGGWKAVMRAELSDKPGQWFEDNVATGLGGYRTREEAGREAKAWAMAEGILYR
jgi:hypothetical protein